MDERARRVVTTAVATYAGRFGTGLSLLVTIPVARHALGADLFGAWMLLSALLGFLAFVDFGIGNVVLNRITAARASEDPAQTGRVLATGYACTGAIGLLVLAAWAAWCAVASDPTAVAGHIAAGHRAAVLHALNVFVFLFAVNIPASLIQKVQLGAQQGHWVGGAQLVAALTTLVAVPASLYLGGGLSALVMASLGVLVLINLTNTLVWLARNQAAFAIHRDHFDPKAIGVLFKAGIPFLAVQAASAFAFQSDAIVITQLLGQSPYGEYAAVQRLFAFASMLISAALVGLWPAFGDALARGEVLWARHALQRALMLASAVMGGLCLLLAFSMGWLAKLWLGTSAPPSLLLTSLFALWTTIEALGMVIGTFLNGAGILRAQAIVAIAMAIVSFALKWILVTRIGPEGGVLATILAYCAISVPTQVFLVRSFFRDNEPGNAAAAARDFKPRRLSGVNES